MTSISDHGQTSFLVKNIVYRVILYQFFVLENIENVALGKSIAGK